jgi:hypothetical protein
MRVWVRVKDARGHVMPTSYGMQLVTAVHPLPGGYVHVTLLCGTGFTSHPLAGFYTEEV